MTRILQTVKKVLTSTSARKIDFRLGTIHVDAVGLGAINLLVSFGQIAVKVRRMKPGVAALYVPSTNTLNFPRDDYGANAQERTDILHECVHALHDMFGGGSTFPKRAGFRFTPRSEDEAAAYVADALYYLYETGGAQSGDDVVNTAAAIARRIVISRVPFVLGVEATLLRHKIVSQATYPYSFDAVTIADGP